MASKRPPTKKELDALVKAGKAIVVASDNLKDFNESVHKAQRKFARMSPPKTFPGGKQEHYAITGSKRNKPCPCGSGLKLKHCCGYRGVH